jgi:hypothetical protein
MHGPTNPKFIPDFIADIFDADRIHLAQDKVLWHESGKTQTVPFNVSLSKLAHRMEILHLSRQTTRGELLMYRINGTFCDVQVLQETGNFVIALATPAFLKLGVVGFYEMSEMIHQTAP